jgi:hypothetical protein
MNNRQVFRLIETLMRNKGSKKSKLLISVIVLIVGYAVLQPVLEEQFGISLPKLPETQRSETQRDHSTGGGYRTDAAAAGEQAVLDAFDARSSDVIVQVLATVKKNLPDDNVGSRHQKMILLLPSGHSVLLAHNIDLADRVPTAEGDTIEVKGEYEYSEQGGVLHWTHHDPRGRHADGWIKHDGVTYK